ncbi:MAG: hypothetical protein IJ882_04875 [Paludibacteraceae bacterium]|nr:hypothetical protein [Paludibacteraceae bacterium]
MNTPLTYLDDLTLDTTNPDTMYVRVGVEDGRSHQYIDFPVSLSYMGINWNSEFEMEFSKDLQRDMNKFYAANNRIPTANEYRNLTEMHLHA